jgi:hypothetical protein
VLICDPLLLSWDVSRSVYEDGLDHIVEVPPYAVMIKFIGHYETYVDMFFHYVTLLDFVLKGNPLLFAFTLVLCDGDLVLCDGDFIYGIRVLYVIRV